MLVKTRCEPAELKLLRYLNRRKTLSEKDKNYYLNLEKGLFGEKMFDEWIQTNLSKDWLVLHDLLLEYNYTVFQIDSLIISPEVFYLFEVKNYEGDFYFNGERWYPISKAEIKNPIQQLSRNESFFRRLLQDLGYKTSTEAKIIFINPEFYLYQAPLNTPIIFSSQLNRFANTLNMNTFEIKVRQLKLAEKLVTLHLKESPYNRLPDYSYDLLVKGIPCAACHSFLATDLGANEKSVTMKYSYRPKLITPEKSVVINHSHLPKTHQVNIPLLFTGIVSIHVVSFIEKTIVKIRRMSVRIRKF